MPDARPMRYYTLPLTPTAKVDISGPFPLTGREWNRLVQLIATMAPGLSDSIADVTPDNPPKRAELILPPHVTKPEA